MRILHVVECLDRGAVENWLVRAFVESRKLRPATAWTFYCALGRAGRLDQTVREHGGQIVYSPVGLSQKFAFIRHLRRTLQSGRFDVLHCHHDFVSGVYLCAALGLPLQKRLVHVHNTDEVIPTSSKLKNHLLREPLRQSCLLLSDAIVGISNHVLEQFLRGRPTCRADRKILYYGLDTAPFQQQKYKGRQFRQELDLPPHAKILLFVGRMQPLKNPVFVVKVLSSMLSQVPAAYAVFCGDGDLRSEVVAEARRCGIAERVRILGWRDDPARLMTNSDLFVFPRIEHPKEGLGLVVVEAQAAGLPMLLSPGIPDDAIVIPELAEVLPLSAGAAHWADRAAHLLRRASIDRVAACDRVATSRFGMRRGTLELLQLYGIPATAIESHQACA